MKVKNTFDPLNLVEIILFLHVLTGTISLLLGLYIYLSKKGGSTHVRIGTYYVRMMTFVFISSVYVSIMRDNLFLLLIGFFSFYLLSSGKEFIRFKEGFSEFNAVTQWVRMVFFGVCFAIMLLFSMLMFLKGNYSIALILFVFGSLGTFLYSIELKIFLLKKVSTHSWITGHIGRMTGSYIAAVTAFLVNNVKILPQPIIWLLPTAIGILIIRHFSKKYS